MVALIVLSSKKVDSPSVQTAEVGLNTRKVVPMAVQASSAGSWLSNARGAASAASDVALSLGQQGWGQLFAKGQAKKAWKRSVHAYKHRYQWTMQDLEKAGLNPILAAGGMTGSSVQAPMASAPVGPSAAAGAAQLRTARAIAKKAEAEAERIEAKRPLYEAEEELWEFVVNKAKELLKRSMEGKSGDVPSSLDLGALSRLVLGEDVTSAKGAERKISPKEAKEVQRQLDSLTEEDRKWLESQPWYNRRWYEKDDYKGAYRNE